VGSFREKSGDWEECEVYLKPCGPLDEKMDFSKFPSLESYMGVWRNSAVYRKGKRGLKRMILFKFRGCWPKESAVLEMSNILNIMGILSEQTRFSIIVHIFGDLFDFLEYCSSILKPQDLDKVI
jgi:hypothetical protein